MDVNYVRKHYLELRNRYGEASLVRTFSERLVTTGIRLIT